MGVNIDSRCIEHQWRQHHLMRREPAVFRRGRRHRRCRQHKLPLPIIQSVENGDPHLHSALFHADGGGILRHQILRHLCRRRPHQPRHRHPLRLLLHHETVLRPSFRHQLNRRDPPYVGVHASADHQRHRSLHGYGSPHYSRNYDRLEGWSGEPCLPSDTVWQWLSCGPTLPPRVTALYLSGYQLNGSLFNFSQMQALVDIDLSNNNLTGQIPSFLGQLPNLKNLNLSYNDFSGAVPISIRNNKRLTFDATGNPNLDYTKGSSSSKALIIGLAVGIPLLVIILLLFLLFWIRSRRAQNQETEPETGNGSINTPQPTAPPVGKDEEEDYVEVNKIDGKVNQESMVPDLDLDELEGLVDQYVNDGNHHRLQDDDDDCVDVVDHSPNDESMVPDLDLEELHDVLRQEKERADELGRPK